MNTPPVGRGRGQRGGMSAGLLARVAWFATIAGTLQFANVFTLRDGGTAPNFLFVSPARGVPLRFRFCAGRIFGTCFRFGACGGFRGGGGLYFRFVAGALFF